MASRGVLSAFKRATGVKPVSYPQCPNCRQKKLKQFYVKRGKKEQTIVVCQFCGFHFEKKPREFFQEEQHPNIPRGGTFNSGKFKGFKQTMYCHKCKATTLFKHLKHPQRLECVICRTEKEFVNRR